MTTLLLILLMALGNDSLPYPAILQDMENVTVHQDSALTELMQYKTAGLTRGEQEMPGWRVQIYSSNDPYKAKQEAESLKALLEDRIDQPVYVEPVQPFWKVRVGNFQTKEEAQAYKAILIRDFPELQSGAYPVRTMIKVR